MFSTTYSNCLFTSKKSSSDVQQLLSGTSEPSDSEGFKSVFASLSADIQAKNEKESIGKSQNKSPLLYYQTYRQAAGKTNETPEVAEQNAKIQARLELDIKRLASFIGIGPKTLTALLGKLNVDPANYNFRLETNSDYAVKSIADYFGISPMTMLAIFDKLKIKPEDLEDKKKTGEIVSKLKELLGFNADQEKELRDILAYYAKKEAQA